MILSPARKFIFVHIPKTGGTSLALALEARANRDDILIGDTPKAIKRKGRVKNLTAKGRLWKHSTLADLDGALSPADLGGMFVFTLVRNPWDRIVSYYHWLRQQGFDHPAVTLAKSTDFTGFVLHPETDASLCAFPAARYVTDATGVERASAYVRLEHLAEDLAPVEDHLGFRLTVPHANASDRPREYRSAYSDQTAAAVAAMCADDIARFGYRFDA
ncbi:sulfotransferase family 2 domain-containing protein [Marivita geojedonensis]|uniref:Type II secretory pathway, pullulanase PulA n=1 Tax=Marivita geojedonensis TaxID=1123756 RepID=A0A1X4NM75_9RHOB|nr:sulfotransferase family 2 domain-containing protein [Marivita geojedonensis]OSQ51405.1 Type II secretory pathway, pullulanase PulA [Marivita geojedonensis]PRY77932.1 sulfotransferase family protein [Marivita geojedonensis]